MTTIALILSWFGLLAMVVLVAFQCQSLVLIASAWIIESPTLLPDGWSSVTLAGISSFA